jgi:hypothetical protein
MATKFLAALLVGLTLAASSALALGQSQDMVGAAIFFASEASTWMTALPLYVDGGFSAGLFWPINFTRQ